jgi:predicted DNA-binding protein
MKALKKKPIQIYLEPQQDDVLNLLAQKRGISKAQIIRKSLEKFFKDIPLKEDPAMGLIGLGSSKKGDLSVQHDKYIARYAKTKGK